MVDWNIQTRLSGERPRIHGVRLSVAYSISPAEVVAWRAVDPFVYIEPLGRELARQPRLPVSLVCLQVYGHKTAHVSLFVCEKACVEPASETAKTLYKRTVFLVVWQT